MIYDSISLNNFLDEIRNGGQKEVIFSILISLEKDCYEGKMFDAFCKQFKQNILQPISKEFNITIRFEIGDSLNRHNWIYRYLEEYLIKNYIEAENQIPKKIRNEFQIKALENAKKQGINWFNNNLEAINKLLINTTIKEDTKLNDEITILYKGDKNNPTIEFYRYDYWLSHPRYNKIKNELNNLCNLKDSIIRRAYIHEAGYFYDRLKEKYNIKNKNLFIKYSYDYLFDETMPYIIKYSERQNIIDFYVNGIDMQVSLAFKGKKAQNDPIIQKYLQNELKGADRRKFVSVKLKD